MFQLLARPAVWGRRSWRLSSSRASASLPRRAAVSVLDDLKARFPPSQLLVVELDVSVNEQIDRAFKTMIDHFGRVDVVVNNAGYVRLISDSISLGYEC